MEYSSSKKGRLPGISFDFDNSDNSDDDVDSCSSLQENNNTNTVEQNRANIIEEMKSMGFQGATTILPSNTIIPQQQQQQHSQPTEVASDNNNNSQTTTPSKRLLTNPPSSNKQSRSTSKPRGNKSTKISPTTSKLHTTANNLVINTPNTTLDKVDNTAAMVIESVNSVKKSIRRSLSPWRNKDDRLISLIAASGGGGDKMSEKEGRSSRSEDSISSGSSGSENKERGEQTAVLDAAADYLYRMDNQYNLSNPSSNTNDNVLVGNWEEVEGPPTNRYDSSDEQEELINDEYEEIVEVKSSISGEWKKVNNKDDKIAYDGTQVRTSRCIKVVKGGPIEDKDEESNNASADEIVDEGIQRRTSRRIQDKQIKEVEEKQAEIDNATLAARELRDKLAAEAEEEEGAATEVDNNQQKVEQKVPNNNNNKLPANNKKGRKTKGRGKSSALSMALIASEDVNTPYKKECIYNLVDDNDEVAGDEVEGAAGEGGDKDEVGKVVSSLARKEEEGGITNTPAVFITPPRCNKCYAYLNQYCTPYNPSTSLGNMSRGIYSTTTYYNCNFCGASKSIELNEEDVISGRYDNVTRVSTIEYEVGGEYCVREVGEVENVHLYGVEYTSPDSQGGGGSSGNGKDHVELSWATMVISIIMRKEVVLIV